MSSERSVLCVEQEYIEMQSERGRITSTQTLKSDQRVGGIKRIIVVYFEFVIKGTL